MSIALKIENSEVLQHDPARAGIFNLESSNDDHEVNFGHTIDAELVGSMALSVYAESDEYLSDIEDVEIRSDDVLAKLNGYLDTAKLQEAFDGAFKSESQLLMVSALIVHNGEAIFSDDVTRLFEGKDTTLKNTFRNVIKIIANSPYGDELIKYGGSGYARDTKYRFGSQWYPKEYADYMQDELATRISNFENRPKTQRAIGSSATPPPPKPTSKQRNNNGNPVIAPKDEVDWSKAICPQTDPESYFPEKGLVTNALKKICVGCEIRENCLQYALDNDVRFGVWGGLSEAERKRLKKQKA